MKTQKKKLIGNFNFNFKLKLQDKVLTFYGGREQG